MDTKDADIRERVEIAIRDQLDAIAKARGERRSLIIREAVREYLDRRQSPRIEEFDARGYNASKGSSDTISKPSGGSAQNLRRTKKAKKRTGTR